jgi:hypothetical protein
MYASASAHATGKPLWASEDDSTYNSNSGAACLARLINRNFVLGNMTATINWNLIAAYTKGTQWFRAGLMNALSPWSGAYGSQHADGSFTAGGMIWAAAHLTQFTAPGWRYLPVDGAAAGSGLLPAGGSYVTLGDFSASAPGAAAADYTIVVEKMSAEHSSCVRPHLPIYPSAPETVTFQLAGPMRARVTTLNVWKTHWAFDSADTTVEFERQAPITVAADGTFSLNVSVNDLWTLTTSAKGGKGAPSAAVPKATIFPAAWTDDFESYPESSEAAFFADQNGIWEIKLSFDATHGKVMQQQVPLRPVTWGGDIRPHSLVGHRDTFDASFVIDAYITEPGASVLLGVHAQGTDDPAGILIVFDDASTWSLYSSIKGVGGTAIATGATPVPVAAGAWHTYRIDINGTTLNVWVDGKVAAAAVNVTGMTTSGHFLIGTGDYGQFTQFDNVQLYSTFKDCGVATPAAGSPVVLANCLTEVGALPHTAWNFDAPPTGTGVGKWNGTFALRAFPTLCLAAAPADAAGARWLQLAACDAADPAQVWTWSFEGIAPDNERKSQISLAGGACIDQYGQNSDIGSPLDACVARASPHAPARHCARNCDPNNPNTPTLNHRWPCNQGENQAFFYDWDEGTIANEATAVCVGVGPCA